MRFFFIIRSGLCSEKSKKQIKKVLFRNLGTNLSSQSTNKHIYVPGITDNLSEWFFSYVVKVPQRFSNVKRISVPKLVRSHAGNIRCYLTCKFFSLSSMQVGQYCVYVFFFNAHDTCCCVSEMQDLHTRVFAYKTFKRKKNGCTVMRDLHSQQFVIRLSRQGYKPILFERIKDFLHYLLVRKGVRL